MPRFPFFRLLEWQPASQIPCERPVLRTVNQALERRRGDLLRVSPQSVAWSAMGGIQRQSETPFLQDIWSKAPDGPRYAFRAWHWLPWPGLYSEPVHPIPRT